jgi:uncharacterized protein YgiM (DUF1202 family)
MRLLGLTIQALLGFVLGIALLAGTGVAVAYWFFSQYLEAPPKPTFADGSEGTEQQRLPQAIRQQLQQGAYRARVVPSAGLNLRGAPSESVPRIGGVKQGQELIVLGSSADGGWQKVYVPQTEQRAWVTAGNLKRTGGG